MLFFPFKTLEYEPGGVEIPVLYNGIHCSKAPGQLNTYRMDSVVWAQIYEFLFIHLINLFNCAAHFPYFYLAII